MSWSSFRDAKTRARWRETLMLKQNGRCALCGHRFPAATTLDYPEYASFGATFDHIVPHARGGADALDNLRLVHSCCNHLRGDAEKMVRIPSVHRSLKEPPLLPHRLRFNAQAEAWCRGSTWKRAHPNLTSAWFAAFCAFVKYGQVQTPYRCGRTSKAWAVVRHRVSKDPWCFDPIIYRIEPIHRSTHGCGFWHLTSSSRHVLVSQALLALPKVMGWEAYHRATDGSWVRKDRECIRGDGLPKKQFTTREEADRCASSMSAPEGRRGRRYRSYVCSSGHIHIGAHKD